jgi:hypothetical protein
MGCRLRGRSRMPNAGSAPTTLVSLPRPLASPRGQRPLLLHSLSVAEEAGCAHRPSPSVADALAAAGVSAQAEVVTAEVLGSVPCPA